MRKANAWLPDLAPPPGGLARLRSDVQARHRQGRAVWPIGAAAACVAVMFVLVLLPGWLQGYRAREALRQVVRQAVQPPDPGRLQVFGGAAVALQSGQAGVRLYLVQSARTNEAAPQR